MNSNTLPSKINKQEVLNAVGDFNVPLTNYFKHLGLPVNNVLYPISDRETVLNSFEDAIKALPINDREKSIYLTRFAASIAAGLFDGALTYLWDETIKSIRKMVIDFDLVYFYTISAEYHSRYKGFSTSDDLENISEYDLITICNRIGLLDDHVFEIFKHINYMRNHSSSAHPNNNGIKAFDLLSWLQNCIDYAINAKPNHSSIQIKQLLRHIRNNSIPNDDFAVIGKDIQKLPLNMIDDVTSSFFGMYTDEQTEIKVKNNIEGLAKYAWDACNKSKKYELGEKYGYFRKNGDVERKNLADRFLRIVSGETYKDEDSLAAEIRETLSSLKSVHFGMNNFYNEYPWVQILDRQLPKNGAVPKTVLHEYIKIICLCYIGNGLGYREGIDENAEKFYKKYINNFKDKEIFIFLELLNDPILMTDVNRDKVKFRFKELCKMLKSQATNIFILKSLSFIIDSDTPIDKLYINTELKDNIAQIKL